MSKKGGGSTGKKSVRASERRQREERVKAAGRTSSPSGATHVC